MDQYNLKYIRLLFQFALKPSIRIIISGWAALASLLLTLPTTFAQTRITISGKVTDAETGEGMPFVNVYFKGTTVGTTTDFNGNYNLIVTNPADTLYASYVGYKERGKAVDKAKSDQVILFQLTSAALKLNEVVIYAGENPSWKIMRKVVKNKDKNDKRSLNFYEYESYNKTEVDVDNISERFQKRKAIQKIQQIIDSVEVIAGEDGKPILPLFISESISNYYYRKDPEKKREHILKTKLTGVGLQDGSLVSQLIGSSFQEYNFYKNWLNILEKDFVSPMADGWRLYYEYLLIDTLDIGGNICYRIDFEPKRVQDLAFTGTMWIDTTKFALKQIDASITKGANLNFVEKIKIQQTLEETAEGQAWLPAQTRVLIDIAEITNQSAGMLAKFYTSNRNFVINKERDNKFYDIGIELDEQAQIKDEAFWAQHRHDSLTSTEKNVYAMIDSIKNIPLVKSYIEVANIVVNGYKKVGIVDVGPYILAYNYNKVEGNRIRLGFKTNIDFSRKFIFKAHAAYGTKDARLKYNGEVHYIISRKPWTLTGIKRNYDIEQIGLLTEDIYDNTLILASARFGTLRRAFLYTEDSFYAQSDIMRGFTQKIRFKRWQFNPLYNFAYFADPGNPNSETRRQFSTSEIILETRLTKGELFVQNDNERISLGTTKPILTLQYTMGLKGVLGSNFNYNKININLSQSLNIGALGRSTYSLTAGLIPSTVPYPILRSHLGNESFFFNSQAFNLMKYFEFVSDKYVSLNYQHSFEGLLFNRIPLVRKLKWRLVATSNILYGSLRPENLNIIPENVSDEGNRSRPFRALGDVPYVEVGYGIENILKFIRIDAIHRLTYLNHPDIQRFGVKISTQFKL
jgi:hypothetical protein